MRKILLYILLPVFLTAGCDDGFLDRDPLSYVTPDKFESERDIINAVNGTYKAMILTPNVYPIYMDFMSDNGFMDKSWSGEVEFWDQSHNPNSMWSEKKWNKNYSGILRANTVLNVIDEVPMDENKVSQYKGEMLFLRSLFYADLIQFYGDVPYRTQAEGIEKQHSPRVSKDTILKNIVEDLDKAAQMLPTSYALEDNGRATKGAALAIKARVLLNNKKWAEAAAACKEVMDLHTYELYDDYSKLFLPEGEADNKEVIFAIQNISGYQDDNLTAPWYTYFFAWNSYMAQANLERDYYMNNGLPISDPASGYMVNYPSLNRDPRLEYTLVMPYSFDGYTMAGDAKTYIPDAKKSANFTSLRIRKWVDYGDDYVHQNSGVNNIIIRYADVLLMRAEALVESGAYEYDEVTGLVNEVRQRTSVGMPKVEDVEGSGLDAEQLRQIIRHERRVEFAFEGTRLMDIQRWDIGAEVISDGLGYRPELLTSRSIQYELYVFRQRTFNQSKGYLWPIPISEINANDSIQVNNPGY
jgi:hypothetical protein